MDFNSNEIEHKWRSYWEETKVYAVEQPSDRPKFYVLDMFPYPSGAGLHVGHPLGYIASDIIARFKRMKGFNVLHPMGFDSFGLPAEQYAIQRGMHPATSTNENIKQYRKQLDNIGFNYDWNRSVTTSDPSYYKWTQWIFTLLFDHYYDLVENKAKSIKHLIAVFADGGNSDVHAYCGEINHFTSAQWNAMSPAEQDEVLMNYRLAYRKRAYVNWCEALGTVLANDEIKDGVSERGGHPVERKPMLQWSLRITAYAERLLNDLETVEWSDALKNMQRKLDRKIHGCTIIF